MIEKDVEIYERSKSSLLLLQEKTFGSGGLSFIAEGNVIDFSDSIRNEEKQFSRECDRILYFFLEKFGYIAETLLDNIAHVGKEDIKDYRYIQMSVYFSYLTKTIKWLVRSRNFFLYNKNYWEGFIDDNNYPLEAYFKEDPEDKRSLEIFIKKVYMAIGTLKTSFFPEVVIIKPTAETLEIFNSVEAFLNKYRRELEQEELEGQAVISSIKNTFSKDLNTPISDNIKICNDNLIYGQIKIPIERGQKALAQMFIDNAKIYRGDTVAKNGSSIEIANLIERGGYSDADAFRDGLKRLRGKIRKAQIPSTIDNVETGKYQMVIRYK